MTERQQVLYLWLAEGALDTATIGWAFHDGTRGRGPGLPPAAPPYASGVAALEDGWFLIQSPAPPLATSDGVQEVGYLAHEFVFERRIALDP